MLNGDKASLQRYLAVRNGMKSERKTASVSLTQATAHWADKG